MQTEKASREIAPVKTLAEAFDVLDPLPLEFEGANASSAWYTPRPGQFEGDEGIRLAGAAEMLQARLLHSAAATKVFLSGHVGSGKSTELKRLAASEPIKKAFSPIFLAIESEHWQHLDIAQLLLFMAGALFDFAHKHALLSEDNAWREPARELQRRLTGSGEVRLDEGKVGVEVDLFFVKLSKELVFQGERRGQLSEMAKKDLTLFFDLIRGIDLDLRKGLALKGDSRSPLLLIDDLDKLRDSGPQDSVFRQNLAALLRLPLRVVYTVPTAVAFDRCPPGLPELLVHLYPIPILSKAPGQFDPEEAINEIGLPFLHAVLRSRVEDGLFDALAVKKAGVYSGGVLRMFFRLLRAAIELARYNDLDRVDGRVMQVAIKQQRLNETMSLRDSHYKALAEVHRTNRLVEGADGSYLDYSYVIECFNDKVWYEANPLFWLLLRPDAA